MTKVTPIFGVQLRICQSTIVNIKSQGNSEEGN